MKIIEVNKTAFTIAEVLITLGIIGIVAAMTLPQLMTSYKQKETATRLKKYYNTIAQASRLAESEYGDVENWWEPNDSPQIKDIFERYKPHLALALEPYYETSTNSAYFRLQDGTCGTFYTNSQKASRSDGYLWQVHFDCGKGTRTYGVTSFTFANINLKDFTRTPQTGVNGRWDDYKIKYGCRNGENYGWKEYECFMKIASNNWEIPKDYNWKEHKGTIINKAPQKGWY